MSEAAGKVSVACKVNGKPVVLCAYPMARLLDVLREVNSRYPVTIIGHKGPPSAIPGLQVVSEAGPGCAIDTIKPEYTEPLKSELHDFIRCVATRERPKVSGAEGRDALRVALEINACIEVN